MKRSVIVITLVVAVVLATSAAWAGPWGGRFYGVGPMVSNLTPQQQQQLLSLQQAHQEKVAPIQEELFKKKMELRSLWATQNPDQAKINALQKEIFDLIDKLQQENNAHRAAVLKVVAP